MIVKESARGNIYRFAFHVQ